MVVPRGGRVPPHEIRSTRQASCEEMCDPSELSRWAGSPCGQRPFRLVDWAIGLGARVCRAGCEFGAIGPFWPIFVVMVRTNTLRRPAYDTADEVEAMGLVRVQIWDA